MANYNDLKTAIQQVIKTNGNKEITGALLQQSLLSMINSLGAGYQFVGVATPTTNPGTPDKKVFYIATEPGVYANFNNINLDGKLSILAYDTNWAKHELNIDELDSINKSLGQLFNVPLLNEEGFYYDGINFSLGSIFVHTLIDISGFNKIQILSYLSGGANVCITDSSNVILKTITASESGNLIMVDLAGTNAKYLYYCTLANKLAESFVSGYKRVDLLKYEEIHNGSIYKQLGNFLPLNNFPQNKKVGAGGWANAKWCEQVFGIIINSPIEQRIKIQKFNRTLNTYADIKEADIYTGLNTVLFDVVNCTKDEFISLDVKQNGLYFVDQQGGGVYKDGDYYPAWEVSYTLLTINNAYPTKERQYITNLIDLNLKEGFFYNGIVYEPAANFKCDKINIEKYAMLFINSDIAGIVNCCITNDADEVLLTIQTAQAINRFIDLSLYPNAKWLYFTTSTANETSAFVYGSQIAKQISDDVTELIQETTILKKQSISWVALGDSFTQINDNIPVISSGYLNKGYLTRVCEKIPQLQYTNMGSGGEQIDYVLGLTIPFADLYTIMFGTNDWYNQSLIIGTKEQYFARNAIANNFLANYGAAINKLRNINPKSKIVVMFPSYSANCMGRDSLDHILDIAGNTGTHANGFTFKQLKNALKECVIEDGLTFVDFLEDSGISQNNVMRYGFVSVNGVKTRLPYPDFLDYVQEGQPIGSWNIYNNSCNGTTYDGKHPTDLGFEIYAQILIPVLRKLVL